MSKTNWQTIFQAINSNDEESIKDLLKDKDVFLEIRDGSIWDTAAHYAVQKGYLKYLTYLLEKDPSLAKVKDFESKTILEEAVRYRNLDIVKFLIEYKYVDIYEPVFLAAAYGKMDILKYILEEKHVDVNILNEHQETPVFMAVQHKLFNSGDEHFDIIKYLVEKKNADLKLLNHNNQNILYAIATNCDLPLMKYVLDERKVKIDTNHKDKFGNTLLHVASDEFVGLWYQHLRKYNIARLREELIMHLIKRKHADVNIANHEGKTPLHIASHLKRRQMCIDLIEHGANVNIKDCKGEVPNLKFMEDAFPNMKCMKNVSKKRNRRNVLQLTSGISRLGEPFTLNTSDRIQRISGDFPQSVIRPASWNKAHAVDFVKPFEFHNFLMLAQMVIGYSKKANILHSESLSSLSPQEILLNKMDPLAIHAIYTVP